MATSAGRTKGLRERERRERAILRSLGVRRALPQPE
jgi:hypothetical protein